MVSDACYESKFVASVGNHAPGDLNLHVRILTVRWGWLGVGRSNCPLSVELGKRIKRGILLNKATNTKEYLLIRLKEFKSYFNRIDIVGNFYGACGCSSYLNCVTPLSNLMEHILETPYRILSYPEGSTPHPRSHFHNIDFN